MPNNNLMALQYRESRELKRAARSNDVAVRLAHLGLAGLYRDQIVALGAAAVPAVALR